MVKKRNRASGGPDR